MISGTAIAKAARLQTVDKLMSPNVRSMSPESYISEFANVLIRDGIGAAPVVASDGTILGVASKTDLVRFEATGADPAYVRLQEIASSSVVTVDSGESTLRAAQIMVRENIHHLVVVDSGRVVGLISAFDFVRLVASGDSNSVECQIKDRNYNDAN